MEFKQKDRDMLKAHDIKLTEVCRVMHKMDIKMDKLSNKMDVNSKTYVTRKMFMWVNGFIILLIMSLVGYTATISTQVTKNTVCIEKIEQRLLK